MRVLVVGGGIGGLSAIIALRASGLDAVAFEQRADVSKTMVGGGFHLWPNSMRVLEELGLGDRARAAGHEIRQTEFHNSRGKTLATWAVDELAREFGGGNVGIARSDLQRMLFEAADDDAVIAGARLVSYEEDEAGVVARFEDGREERGDVLVGADGSRSVVRRLVLDDGGPDYAGYVQWQTVVEDREGLLPEGHERITFGPGTRTVMHAVGNGRVFWACVLYAPESEAGPSPGRKQRLLEIFGDWPAPIGTAIERTPEEQIDGLPVYERRPQKKWGAGRVTLLGDAAHAMTTNTSQGGNMAIEDGLALARRLKAGAEDPQAALREYERVRYARTTPLVKQSHFFAWLGAWDGVVRPRIRDRMMAFVVPRKGLKDLRAAVAAQV
ncbi:MAG TPA: NAD(P)/FAD-dependent oxidoreductase [Thermoleophilaceae bacterium]|nr:NAD(P)/FAD-dependent oxidoreductase [Thermoleophilaceae bacterium]